MASRNTSKISLIALTLGCTSAFTFDAGACGGLFCSNSNPVNQAAERIIFAQNPDQTVTAAIEILYDGPAHEFAWVLPVAPGDIEVGVSSKQALDALQQASNPVYRLNTVFECNDGAAFGATGGAGSVATPSPSDPAAESPAVEVLDSGTAGPYAWELIQVNPELDDRADVAVAWLEEHGYDVSALGPEVLRPYLDQDMNLVAVKLSKNADAGSIRPMMISYPGTQPSIPIRPTAVAANDNMGVMVWTLGPSRAVPLNYLDLQLNEALINWFNPGPDYNTVVTAAADEAGGQGFVTEQSGDASAFAEVIYPTSKKDQWQTNVRNGTFSSIEAFFEMVRSVMTAPSINAGGGFAGPLGAPTSIGLNYYDGFAHVLAMPEIVPLREGATPEQFLSCVSCYFEENVAVRTDIYPETPFVPDEDPLLSMDVGQFMDAIEEYVLDPLQATQDLFNNNDKITRFYTTMSPEDMTADPLFDFNADLTDYSNLHVADRVMMCEPTEDVEWSIDLPQGMHIEGVGQTWPITLESGIKANLLVRQMGTEGNGAIVENNAESIADEIVVQGAGTAGELLTLVEEQVAASDPFVPMTEPEVDEEEPSKENPEEENEPSSAIDEMTEEEQPTTKPRAEEEQEVPDEDEESVKEPSDSKSADMDLADMSAMDTSSNSDGGCSVAIAPASRSSFPVGFGMLMGLGMLARRRRRRQS